MFRNHISIPDVKGSLIKCQSEHDVSLFDKTIQTSRVSVYASLVVSENLPPPAIYPVCQQLNDNLNFKEDGTETRTFTLCYDVCTVSYCLRLSLNCYTTYILGVCMHGGASSNH